jgi:Lrp/AsnC family transcriptional regulator, leucine-responsive regulatory protein
MINNTGLDDLDLALLSALQRNARSTFAELGALVGLKAPSVHDRVKRLEARGFIRRYGAQLDGRKLGLGLTAFVSCYVSSDTTYDQFTANASKLPEVCEVHSVAGEETYLLKVMTRSTEHLDDFLSRLKLVPGLIRTKTTIVLSTPFERGGIAIEQTAAPGRRLRSVTL